MTSQEESIRQVIQQIKEQDPNFFCLHSLHILTWKSKTVPNGLITKVNGQRYLGLLRKDIKGQDYWKYKPLKENNSDNPEENPSQPALDNTAKFQPRQEKAGVHSELAQKTQPINHGESNNSNEQSINE